MPWRYSATSWVILFSMLAAIVTSAFAWFGVRRATQRRKAEAIRLEAAAFDAAIRQSDRSSRQNSLASEPSSPSARGRQRAAALRASSVGSCAGPSLEEESSFKCKSPRGPSRGSVTRCRFADADAAPPAGAAESAVEGATAGAEAGVNGTASPATKAPAGAQPVASAPPASSPLDRVLATGTPPARSRSPSSRHGSSRTPVFEFDMPGGAVATPAPLGASRTPGSRSTPSVPSRQETLRRLALQRTPTARADFVAAAVDAADDDGTFAL